MKLCCLGLCTLLFLVPVFHSHALEAAGRGVIGDNTARNILQIFEEQPDAIEGLVGDRIYLAPQRIAITHRGAFLCHRNSMIPLPSFALDQRGIFVRCKKSETNQEAQEHYDKALEALIDALGHSIGAGATIVDIPPLGIYEGYKAVEAWKEAGREYHAGVEAEERGTYTPPEPKSSRDD